jgi:hypothetical protein
MAIENVMAVRKGKVFGPPSSVGPTWEDNNASGSKNLIPYPWEQPTESTSGLSWTDNGDGTFTVNGSVTSGKSNGAIRFRNSKQDYILPAGEYWLSGCPAGGTEYTTDANTTYYVWVYVYHSDGTHTDYHEIGNGKKVTILDDDLYIRGGIGVFEGAGTVSNLTFKPMLRRIEDPDGTYEPFAMTNQQITKKISSDTGWINIASTDRICNYRKIGNLVTVWVQFKGNENTGWVTVGTLPVGARPLYLVYQTLFSNWTTTPNYYNVVGINYSNGAIQIFGNGSLQGTVMFVTAD